MAEPVRARGVQRADRAWHLADRTQGLEGRADRHARPAARGAAGCSAGARALAEPRSGARRVSPGKPARPVPAGRPGGPRLYQRLRPARGHQGAGLFRVRAGTARRRQRGRRQPWLRAEPAPECVARARSRWATAPRHHRRDAMARIAQLVRDRRTMPIRTSGSCATSRRWRRPMVGARSRRSISTRRRRCRRAACRGRRRSRSICATSTCNMH